MSSKNRIFKYVLEMYPSSIGTYDQLRIEVPMPHGAQILCVKAQGDAPCVWALVDSVALTDVRVFEIYTTGATIELHGRTYLGTILYNEGTDARHIFECAIDPIPMSLALESGNIAS